MRRGLIFDTTPPRLRGCWYKFQLFPIPSTYTGKKKFVFRRRCACRRYCFLSARELRTPPPRFALITFLCCSLSSSVNSSGLFFHSDEKIASSFSSSCSWGVEMFGEIQSSKGEVDIVWNFTLMDTGCLQLGVRDG